MTTSLKYIAVLAVLPLFLTGLGTDYTGAEAASSGSAEICGLQLCSDFPGGRDAWIAQLGVSTYSNPVPVPDEATDEMMTEPMPEEVVEETTGDAVEADPGSVLKLSRANVPATIPMHQGYYDGEEVYFIITDSSDPTHADIVTASQGWQVELAPLLKHAPEEALSTTYLFTNGIEGDGVHRFQGEIFTSTPAQTDTYSALTAHIHVTWHADTVPRVLDSEAAVLDAVEGGEVTLSELPVIMNMPHIVWPEGQMMINEAENLEHDTPYGGGQVLDIDTEEMTVTFIAHRGWGPDGRTIYYIVTDATPSGPAGGMGVVYTPTSANMIANAAAVDLFQFRNGITGSGPLGFQPGIASGAPGDINYSPMWRIFMVGWENPEQALLLESIGDIQAHQEEGLININVARPMDSDHIVNCPFIDPFQ